jgi:hypothetical protein
VKKILLSLLFVLCISSPRILVAEETVMTDSGAEEETSDGSYMTDSGEVKSVSEDGSYMNDSGEMGEADVDSEGLGGDSSSGDVGTE